MDEIERIAEDVWPGRWALVTEMRGTGRRIRYRSAIAWRDGRIPLEAFGATQRSSLRALLGGLRQIEAERPVAAALRASAASLRHQHRAA